MPEKLIQGRLRRSIAIAGSSALIGAAALGGNEMYQQRNDNSNRTNLTEHVTDEFVPSANDYDREKVREDAEGFQLAPEWEAVNSPNLLDHVHDDLVVEANKYDRDKVARLAAGFQLDPEWEAVPDPRENETK